MVCLLTAIWQKFHCTVLIICTILMGTRLHLAATRRQNERTVRWNNTVCNLPSRNPGRLVLMDLEYELRAQDQPRFTVDGIHIDTIEGQAYMNSVLQERLNELEIDWSDRGETGNEA